jgi:hypothetical protein
MSNIKNLTPKFGKFKQGYYKVENPHKYIGDLSKVIFRSSWEYKFMRYCDLTEKVISWSSEPVAIKYISPLDNRQHNYYIDFYTKIKLNESEVIEYLVEVKPIKDYRSKPLLEGKRTPKKLQVYENELKTYLINNVKFETAQRFAESNNMKFIILNETNIKNL